MQPKHPIAVVRKFIGHSTIATTMSMLAPRRPTCPLACGRWRWP